MVVGIGLRRLSQSLQAQPRGMLPIAPRDSKFDTFDLFMMLPIVPMREWYVRCFAPGF